MLPRRYLLLPSQELNDHSLHICHHGTCPPSPQICEAVSAPQLDWCVAEQVCGRSTKMQLDSGILDPQLHASCTLGSLNLMNLCVPEQVWGRSAKVQRHPGPAAACLVHFAFATLD